MRSAGELNKRSIYRAVQETGRYKRHGFAGDMDIPYMRQ
jgi:hypothetical protein